MPAGRVPSSDGPYRESRTASVPLGIHKTRAARCWIVIALLVTFAGGADLHAQLSTRVHASGFTFPVAFIQDPADRTEQLVLQQDGHIRIVQGAAVLTRDFLDLTSAVVSGGEQGLLGFAFAPDYTTSRRFFVNFTNRQ